MQLSYKRHKLCTFLHLVCQHDTVIYIVLSVVRFYDFIVHSIYFSRCNVT